LADTQQNPIPDLVNQAREQLAQQFGAHAEQLQKLEQGLQELRSQYQQLEQAVQQQLDQLAKVELPSAPPPVVETSLEKVLAAVRDLITATLPEQVLEVFTEEAEQLGVRAAVFDVRGKAAWGSSARGFGPGLSEKAFRGLVVSLSQDNPFRTCYETGGHVDTSVGLLKKNRNLLDKLRPASDDPILLLPVRSAGSVSAIFYADGGGKQKELPVDALKILAEFAGAQLDRLMAFSGGVSAPVETVTAEPEEVAPVVEEAAPQAPAEAVEVEPVEAPVAEEVSPVAAGAEAAAMPVLGETIPVEEAPPPPPPPTAPPVEEPVAATPAIEEPVAAPPPPPPPAPAPAAPAVGFDVLQLSETDQKIHRDAKRFAKLLVSEIELYNKAKVMEGRKTADLYKRLKSDIDRSRQTYEKRFGKTVAKQYDYFHEELVKTLAGNDSSLLGPDYSGPSV
jgi:hypothetical protein